MPPQKISLFFLSLLVLSASGIADTVFLKDGSEIKGEIIENQPDAVVIEYSVTPTIKDQKTVPRANILKIMTVSDAEKAYLALGSRTAPSTVLETSFYDSLLDKSLPAFIRQYPYTSHITELREEIRRLTAERDRIRQGDRRIDGVWITAAQIAANPYQMEAKMKFLETKQAALSTDTVTALKKYELLEAAYPGSRVMPDAIDLAISELNLLQGELSTAKANFDTLDTRRQQSIAAAPPDQAKEIQNAIDGETQAAKDAIEKAGKDGTKLFPVFPNNKDALDQLQSVLDSEQPRLVALRAIPMRESLAETESAAQFIAEGKLKEAQEQLDLAAQKWPPNEEITQFRRKLEEARKAAAATHTP